MRRYNLIQARGAEFTSGTEGIATESEGNDVIEVAVKRGTVSIIVPATLPDGEVGHDRWFNNHTCIDIELEDGKHITGWIRGGEAYLGTEVPAQKSKSQAARIPTPTKSLVQQSVLSKGLMAE